MTILGVYVLVTLCGLNWPYPGDEKPFLMQGILIYEVFEFFCLSSYSLCLDILSKLFNYSQFPHFLM